MHINIEEIIRIKGRLEDIEEELGSALTGIDDELTEIGNNIQSYSLRSSNRLIHESITNLIDKINTNLDGLIVFMTNQMKSYEASNDKALIALQELVQNLEEVFGKKADATGSIKLENLKATSVQDETINDQTAYTQGENDRDFLENKLGDSQTSWENLETSYYYFKEKGLTDEQIAGILGNMTQESGFVLDAKNSTSTATGLFQWLNDRHPDDWSIESQLDHAWKELSETRYNGDGLGYIKDTTTVDAATQSFALWFEGYGFEGGELAARQRYAHACYWYIKNL